MKPRKSIGLVYKPTASASKVPKTTASPSSPKVKFLKVQIDVLPNGQYQLAPKPSKPMLVSTKPHFPFQKPIMRPSTSLASPNQKMQATFNQPQSQADKH